MGAAGRERRHHRMDQALGRKRLGDGLQAVEQALQFVEFRLGGRVGGQQARQFGSFAGLASPSRTACIKGAYWEGFMSIPAEILEQDGQPVPRLEQAGFHRFFVQIQNLCDLLVAAFGKVPQREHRPVVCVMPINAFWIRRETWASPTCHSGLAPSPSGMSIASSSASSRLLLRSKLSDSLTAMR